MSQQESRVRSARNSAKNVRILVNELIKGSNKKRDSNANKSAEKSDKCDKTENTNKSDNMDTKSDKIEKSDKPEKECKTEDKVQPKAEYEVIESAHSSHSSQNSARKWKIGQKVEARDSMGQWYPAKVIDIQDDKALIHFERWSSRFDEWREMNDLRPKTGNNAPNSKKTTNEWKVGERCYARWNDGKMYCAKIMAVPDDNEHIVVLFEDGYRKKVRRTAIQSIHEKELKQETITNQISLANFVPTKEFRISADHNEYKCEFAECGKSFRKIESYNSHLRHYHSANKKGDNNSASDETDKSGKESDKPEKTNINVETNVSSVTSSVTSTPISTATTTTATITTTTNTSTVTPSTPITTNVHRSSERSSHKRRRPERRATECRKSLRVSANSLPVIRESVSTPTHSTVDLIPNLILPFWDARDRRDESEIVPELVNCKCDLREDSGLMVGCEYCLCWGHSECLGFQSEKSVPEDYICQKCRSPRLQRKNCALSAFYTNNWLKKGKMPSLTSNNTITDQEMKTTNQIVGSVLELKDVLHSLSVKINKLPKNTSSSAEDDETIDASNDVEISRIASTQETIAQQLEEIEAVLKKMDDESEDNDNESSREDISVLINDLNIARKLAVALPLS